RVSDVESQPALAGPERAGGRCGHGHDDGGVHSRAANPPAPARTARLRRLARTGEDRGVNPAFASGDGAGRPGPGPASALELWIRVRDLARLLSSPDPRSVGQR